MNPFSLDFGAEPNLYISRDSEINKIISNFNAEIPSTHIYMLTGVRGSGKTVLMTSVSHRLVKEKQWMHLDLNGERNILESLAAYLYKSVGKKSKKIKSVGVKGISLEIENDTPYHDVQGDIDDMLSELKKKDLKLLLTLDETSNAQNIREFTTYFQHALREEYPVFLLMTGLYKNIRALQNNRSQTFLRRAPKIELAPLNLRRIAIKYEEVFEIGEDEAVELAKLTGGYSYAFQILGYILYDHEKKEADKSVLNEYRLLLEESSYEKIWEELSSTEQQVAIAIAEAEEKSSIKSIRESIDMDSNNFSTYQATLENMGILSGTATYGTARFALPFFKEFVKTKRI